MFISRQRSNRGFLIPLDVVAAARQEGIGLERLQEMVRLSTRITHPQGNRRYAGYLFLVEGSKVVAFGKIQDVAITKPDAERSVPAHASLSSVDEELEVTYRCEHCKDSGRVQAFDPCPHCDGVGCPKCDEGLVPSSIPCPMCASGRKLPIDKRA